MKDNFSQITMDKKEKRILEKPMSRDINKEIENLIVGQFDQSNGSAEEPVIVPITVGEMFGQFINTDIKYLNEFIQNLLLLERKRTLEEVIGCIYDREDQRDILKGKIEISRELLKVYDLEDKLLKV